MTKFLTLKTDSPKKVKKETYFVRSVGADDTHMASTQPSDWDNVMHIGQDKIYNDVFKVWNDGNKNFKIYFGVKGDEFD